MRVLAVLLALSGTGFAQDLDTLGKAIDEHPDDVKAYDAFAVSALKAKRYDDVIKRVKSCTARLPDCTQGYYWLALAYRSKKEWADAADYYRRYIEKNPSKTDPYFGLGASLEGLGDKKGAIAAYDKYVSLEKDPAKQRFVLLAKQELEKLDPSRKPPEAPPPPPPPVPTIANLPPPSPPQANAGQLRAEADKLRKDGKLDDAAQAYQRAIDADRGNVDLYNDLGNCYFAMKKYDQAASAFRDATSRDPNYALGWYNLAHALRKGDHKQEAVGAYRQYMKLKPDDPDPYYGLGQTLKALGDYTAAIEAFRKYIAMEKRPEEQRWVDKAKTELEALEAQQRGSSAGKIEEKSSLDELDRDRLAPQFPARIDKLRDLKDPFDRDGILPVPFEEEPPMVRGPEARRDLVKYERALVSYLRALSKHAEEVSQRYERGVAFALADDSRGALRAFNAIQLEDPALAEARTKIESVRKLLASRK